MYQKEFIKDRMLKEASRIWNAEGAVTEDSFDPLVNMLISGLACEVEHVYKEMAQAQERVAYRLMSKLVPEIHRGVCAGHAMAILNPGEKCVMLPKHSKLSSQIRFESTALKEVKFLTADAVCLIDGGISSLHTPLGSYDIIDKRFKVESKEEDRIKVDSNELLLVVKTKASVTGIDHIPLFFEVSQNSFQRSLFYEQLSRAKFYVNDSLSSSVDIKGMGALDVDTSDQLNNAERSAIGFYKHQSYKIKVPDTLKTLSHNHNDLHESHTELSIRIVFNDRIPFEVLSDLMCYNNVVPIINLEENQKIYKSIESLSVFSLTHSQNFYAIKSIYNDEGKEYKEYNDTFLKSENDAVYVVRNEEVEGFSEERAKDLISYLIGKLRNENAMFSNVTKGSFNNDIRNLNQITSRLEQALNRKSKNDRPVYVFIKNKEKADHIFIEFYTTYGAEIKNFKINSPLFSIEGTDIQHQGNFTITPLSGARNPINAEEHLSHVRHSILAGNRIVTHRDITSLVQKYFGVNLENVEVKKGFKESMGTKTGFLRTIDIYTTVKKSVGYEDVISIGKMIQQELEDKSSNVFPYQLFINKELIRK